MKSEQLSNIEDVSFFEFTGMVNKSERRFLELIQEQSWFTNMHSVSLHLGLSIQAIRNTVNTLKSNGVIHQGDKYLGSVKLITFTLAPKYKHFKPFLQLYNDAFEVSRHDKKLSQWCPYDTFPF